MRPDGLRSFERALDYHVVAWSTRPGGCLAEPRGFVHRPFEMPARASSPLNLHRSDRAARSMRACLRALMLSLALLGFAARALGQPSAPRPTPPPPAGVAQPPAATEEPTVEPPEPVAPLQPSDAAAATEPGYDEVEYEEAPAAPHASQKGPQCLIGNLCFGPVLTAGIVDVFGFGVQARTDFWGVGFDYQFVRFSTRGIPVRLSLLTVEGRIYPFGGAFFLAGGLAWQAATLRGHISYQGDSQIPPIETDVSGRVSVPVFKLGVGFMGRDGFVMGIDLALGLQLGRTRVTFSSDLPRIQQVIDIEDKIRGRADTWVRGLPFLLQVNVLRFGFLF
jgi:hypothetical protein